MKTNLQNEGSFRTFDVENIESIMSLMISISGVRGIVGETLTPEVIVRYSSAFGEYCAHGPIVLGRDGRSTGKIIGNVVSSTLLSMGCDVIALGVCPTPTVQLGVEKYQAHGGISITASHNPIQWNGLKFLASTGLLLNHDENRALLNIAAQAARSYATWEKIGTHREDPDFLNEHLHRALSISYVEPEQIRSRRFKVVVDCVDAAGGLAVPRLLRELGCDVIEMNCEISGIFSHAPEPIPENLTDLCRRVPQEHADLGIAVDPDVDRLVLIDERGEPIGEEYTIASVVQFVLAKETARKGGSTENKKTVAVNLSTTRAVDDIARSFGASVVRTPVGEINVAAKMKEVGAVIGGEGSGGVILPEVHYGRDAIVGIVLTLQHLVEFGGSLSDLRRSLPNYVITKAKVPVQSTAMAEIFNRVRAKYERAGSVNAEDGLKIDFSDSWVHLRKSNTEPIVRIIAEAPSKNRADELVREISSMLN